MNEDFNKTTTISMQTAVKSDLRNITEQSNILIPPIKLMNIQTKPSTTGPIIRIRPRLSNSISVESVKEDIIEQKDLIKKPKPWKDYSNELLTKKPLLSNNLTGSVKDINEGITEKVKITEEIKTKITIPTKPSLQTYEKIETKQKTTKNETIQIKTTYPVIIKDNIINYSNNKISIKGILIK